MLKIKTVKSYTTLIYSFSKNIQCFSKNIISIRPMVALKYPGVVKVIIPNTVTIIEKYAFYQCHDIEEVYIPESVIEICDCAFLFL